MTKSISIVLDEAEYIAASKAKKGATWREVLLRGLGVDVEERPIGRPPRSAAIDLQPQRFGDPLRGG